MRSFADSIEIGMPHSFRSVSGGCAALRRAAL
jgi:hypothetical protein